MVFGIDCAFLLRRCDGCRRKVC